MIVPLGHLLSPRLLADVAPEHVHIDGDQVLVDLKAGALAALYEVPLANRMPVLLPVLGSLRLVDLLTVTGLRTNPGELLLDFDLDPRLTGAGEA